MTWHFRPRHGRARIAAEAAAGFTLVELLVALALVALVGVLVVGASAPVSPASAARAAAGELASALRLARAQAIAEDRPVGLVLDVAGRRYRVGRAAGRALPQVLRLTLLTARGEVLSDSTASIRFNPDGSSSGGRIEVAGGGRLIAIRVEWLSGRVSLVEHG
ncbi:MAG: GspH/FimT family protein [Alphaproteobacteria bacterium]